MTIFSFDTITAAQALAITNDDSVAVPIGTASQTTVLFNPDGSTSVVVGARTVVFGEGLNASPRANHFAYADGSQLYIGNASPNAQDFGNATPGRGAIYGGDGNDSLSSGAGAWLLQGNQGDDQLSANVGSANTIYGGQGNDFIAVSGAGVTPVGQFIQGNKGDDRLFGGNGGDTLLGGQGSDSILGNGGVDFVNGNLGDDTLSGTGQLFGEGGNDSMFAGSEAANTARGGDGDDYIAGSVASTPNGLVGPRHTFFGDDGNDTLTTVSPEHDELFGGAGNDSLRSASAASAGDLLDGGDGADTLSARNGDDTLSGGLGDDSLMGGEGDNRLQGGGGNDVLSGQSGTPGRNQFDGGDGDDTITDSVNADTISGGAGNDSIVEGGGDNLIDGGAGNDVFAFIFGGTATILGGAGDDTVNSTGADRLNLDGGDGADSLGGTGRNDTISGGDGADTVAGGDGVDILFGGAGADLFIQKLASPVTPGTIDQIRDWSVEDHIQLRTGRLVYTEITSADFDSAVATVRNLLAPGAIDVVAAQIGGDVVIFVDGASGATLDSAVVLVGRSLADVSADNFI